MERPPSVAKAWRPRVPGVREVLHAHFFDHAYPMHTHDTWDLMLLDRGAVGFTLDRREHGNGDHDRVILLPPGVPHDGRTVNAVGFSKRVLYVETSVLSAGLTGAALNTPIHHDGLLRARLSDLHQCLTSRGDVLEAESRLVFIRDRLLSRLRTTDDARTDQAQDRPSSVLAREFRDLLDDSLPSGLTLAQAARVLEASPSRLVRAFSATYGLPPHRYLTSRRIESARQLLLAGTPIAETATAVGFHDQSHLHRHFRRFLDTTPGQFVCNP